MKLPTSIRVGYRDVKIEAWDALAASGESKFGKWAPLSGIISIRENLPPQELANTLLHELMHAMHFTGGIQGGEKSEEDTVIILTNQLCQVWRDNPEFVAFMSEALSSKTQQP